jgi:GGDEF domain-containing protein
MMLSGGQSVSVGVSVGIAESAPADTSPALLLAKADKALYEVKQRSPSRRDPT